MTGTPYDGGGIAVSVAATRAASDDELRALVAARVAEMRAQGTTTVEIKSGYGLTLEDELRSLRIARELTPHTTFLGAHVVPREYAARRAAYVDLVTGPMLDAVVADGPTALAESIDVFCEPHSAHAFDGDEARTILEAGRAAGLALRVHGNQLGHGPGVRLACELGARSVDHCTFLDDADVEALVAARGTTVATLLPGVEFSTRSPYPDGRALIDAGVDVALASDCNPGTCYSSSIPFAIALAVREMGLTPGRGAARRDGGVGALARPRPTRRARAAGRAGRPRRAEPPAPRLPGRGADRARARALAGRRLVVGVLAAQHRSRAGVDQAGVAVGPLDDVGGSATLALHLPDDALARALTDVFRGHRDAVTDPCLHGTPPRVGSAPSKDTTSRPGPEGLRATRRGRARVPAGVAERPVGR